MSRIALNVGSAANDGTGDKLRTAAQSINANFRELYLHEQRLADLTALNISDSDGLYAHESQVIVKRLYGKTFAFIMCMIDKTSAAEWALTGHAYLYVYELTKMTLLKTFDLFYPNLTAGVTFPNEATNQPRMWFVGDVLHCVASAATALYTRTITISDAVPDNFVVSNMSIMQATMKDSGGSNVTVDINAAHIQTHLEYTLGDTYTGYNNLCPILRNTDNLVTIGSNTYLILECSAERGAGGSNIPILLKSPDSGATWSFSYLINYTTSNRKRLIESALVYIGTTLHVISRTTTAYIEHNSSTDYGATWAASSNLSLNTIGSKPCAINYSYIVSTSSIAEAIMLAVNETDALYGIGARTTLAFYTTTDFVTLTEVTRIVSHSYAHYPGMCHFSNCLYTVYTRGLKYDNEHLSSSPIGCDRNTIAFARVY